MSPRSLEGVPLNDVERAAARHMLAQALEVRCQSCKDLQDALAAEESAASALNKQMDELSDAKWPGLTENVRRFRSDILRCDLYGGGRNVFPVKVVFGSPVLCGGF